MTSEKLMYRVRSGWRLSRGGWGEEVTWAPGSNIFLFLTRWQAFITLLCPTSWALIKLNVHADRSVKSKLQYRGLKHYISLPRFRSLDHSTTTCSILKRLVKNVKLSVRQINWCFPISINNQQQLFQDFFINLLSRHK